MRPIDSSLTRRELLKLGAVAGLGAAGLSNFGCSRGDSKDQIVVSRPEEFQKLDAADQFNLVNYTLFIHVFDTLVEMDESGKIVHVYENVKPAGHSAELLAVLKVH